MIKCQVIIDAMEKIAPCYLTESWDNTGLLIGDPSDNIEKIFVCLDVTEEVLNQAINENCQMIISHHPLIFKPLKNLRFNTPLGALIKKIITNNISIFAAHTNFDIASGGLNDYLCHLLSLKDVKPLYITYKEPLLKLSVFVPKTHAKIVREAIGNVGAGYVGNYSHCSFTSSGEGRFLPLENSNPFLGKLNQLEKVNEDKIETILPLSLKQKVIKAILKSHPYEEPAYDFCQLDDKNLSYGLGRIGILNTPLKINDFLLSLKNIFPEKSIRFIKGKKDIISKIGLCSGAGAEFIDKAKFSGADIYITGDVKYHEARHAEEIGLNLVDKLYSFYN